VIHHLGREQFIPAEIGRVWDYFATPANLDEMTPPDMAFEIVWGGEGRMQPGQLIEYRVEVLPGWKTRWLTEIRHVREGQHFVDEQRAGPYRFWYHEHHFEPMIGGVRMKDRVTYELPFGVLGEALHALVIRPRLEAIFDFRYREVEELFG
jgi:ligand-binding SRPBCC domain-containing protein